jgi:1-acyl-sn-glycerol-3-phosphate acyltransferase
VPIAIWGTGKFNPTGIFPLTSFSKMSWTTLMPIDTKGKTAEEVCLEVEIQISSYLKKFL